jgi:protein involved in polysaccharide export with SLBB domain
VTSVGGVRDIGRILFLVLALIFFSIGTAPAADDGKGYTLGAGDKLRITVYNEPDLSGEFEVSGQGLLSVPLLGQVQVMGKTTGEVQAILTQKYGKDYLVNPSVSVEVLNYRPFFIIGEVNHPGSYPYVNGMTVINAVALAGGYTPRANHEGIKIKHSNQTTAQEQDAKEDTVVLPGDVIEVAERFF